MDQQHVFTHQIAIGTLIGPYSVVEEKPQGMGGMARVYIARFAPPGSEPHYAALKIVRTTNSRGNSLHPADIEFYSEALNNEVETLRRLRHPNIVRLYPIHQDDGRKQTPYIARALNLPGQPWYCVMEYLAGGSLEARIRRLGKLYLSEAVEIGYQIALALDHIHSKGFAHLDLKPDNILFRRLVEANSSLEPVLIDFGVAAKLKKTGLQAGAVPYMSPERLRLMRGELPPDQAHDQSAADVYSLGILLYRMLTGHLPFESSSRDRLIRAILEQLPTRPTCFNRDIPDEVESLILRILEKEPGQRPPLEEVTTLLDKALPPPRLAAKGRSVAVNGRGVERSYGRLPTGLFVLGAAALVGLGTMFGWTVYGLDGQRPTRIQAIAVTVPPAEATTAAPMSTATMTAPSATATELLTLTPSSRKAAEAATFTPPGSTATETATLTPVPGLLSQLWGLVETSLTVAAMTPIVVTATFTSTPPPSTGTP